MITRTIGISSRPYNDRGIDVHRLFSASVANNAVYMALGDRFYEQEEITLPEAMEKLCEWDPERFGCRPDDPRPVYVFIGIQPFKYWPRGTPFFFGDKWVSTDPEKAPGGILHRIIGFRTGVEYGDHIPEDSWEGDVEADDEAGSSVGDELAEYIDEGGVDGGEAADGCDD